MNYFITPILIIMVTAFSESQARERVNFGELVDKTIQDQNLMSKDIADTVQPLRLDENETKLIKITHDIVRQKTTLQVYRLEKSKRLESDLVEKAEKVAASPNQ